ncbi:hypothetical protein CLI64_19235 [Nostoc sp. CENA543]|uniref:pentapeptide repeat-containing protein n=1 Tax=Nostoc sp. CENA543 TaxID=1869241 RepID=UPI000CA3A07E|nr:pentapeptide repeat-containing protein [Nostoc sp. CENA543]AUT02351.1 hypothetical protein CLI64_19235 [Nostoc sp. CENA543]
MIEPIKRLLVYFFTTVVVIILMIIVLFIIWRIPQLQVIDIQEQIDILKSSSSQTIDYQSLVNLEKIRIDAENASRTVIVKFFGGLFFCITAFISFLNYRETKRNVSIAEEKQITERFSKAIEQLESENTHVRIGAIYSLERIAKDSNKDYWQIIEILTTYVRKESHNKPKSSNYSITATIEAAVNILNRRALIFKKGDKYSLDLSGSNLEGLNLKKVTLKRVNLSGACLQNVNFEDAELQEANLENANLSGAILKNAKLNKVNLRKAKLFNTNLEGADLSGADLRSTMETRVDYEECKYCDYPVEVRLDSANLKGANLKQADLTGAILNSANLQGANLKQADLTGAILNSANLQGANLKRAKLIRASLVGTSLQNADLEAADLNEAQLSGSIPKHDPIFDEEVFICTHANLNGTNLKGTILKNAIFEPEPIKKRQITSGNNWDKAVYDSKTANLLGVLKNNHSD